MPGTAYRTATAAERDAARAADDTPPIKTGFTNVDLADLFEEGMWRWSELAKLHGHDNPYTLSTWQAWEILEPFLMDPRPWLAKVNGAVDPRYPFFGPDDRSITVRELLALDIPPATWAIDRLIPSEGIAILAAPEKRGKSLLEIQMLLSIAAGIPVLGKAVTRSPTLLIEPEGGRRHFQDRVRTEAAGLGLDAAVFDVAHVSHRSNLQIDTDQGIHWLRREIGRTGARVVFIGPLSQVMSIADENKASEVNQVVRERLQPLVSDLGVVIVLVHHANKAATVGGTMPSSVAEAVNGIRGSNAWAGAADAIIIMHRSPEQDEGQLFVEARDAESFKQWYQIDWTTYLVKAIDSPTVLRAQNEQAEIMAVLVEHGALTIRELRQIPPLDRYTDDQLRPKLNAMVDRRFLVAEKADKKGTLRYAPTTSGSTLVTGGQEAPGA